MKRFFLVLQLSIIALGVAAQQQAPVLQFMTTNHNFGDIQEDNGVVSVDFKLKNTGNAPLILTRVATSCGCTASEWTKEPILPGNEGVVTVSYNPKGRPGQINQRITVYSNTSGGGVVLSLRGQVIPRPKTKAEIYRRRIGNLGLSNTHVSLGVVYVDQVKTDTLKTFNFGTEPITISAEGAPKNIKITAVPTKLNPEQEGYILFTFDAKGVNDWGYNLSRAQIVVDKKSSEKILVNISARIEEDFSKLSAKQLEDAPRIEFSEIQKDFGDVKEGDVIEHEFVFTNTGKSDLIIRKIQASCGCTTVAPKVTVIKAGQQSSLSASFRTQGFTGRQSKTITVITNDPKNSSIVLRLMGTVAKAE